MAVKVTYCSSRSTIERSVDSTQDIVEYYQVSGVTSAADAEIADGVPDYNVSHPARPQSLLRSKFGSGGPSLYTVECRYAIPPNGQWAVKAPDPLTQPFRVRTRWGVTSVPSDCDADGNPIYGVNGGVPNPLPNIDKRVKFLEVRWNIRAWTTAMEKLSLLVMDAVNSNDFTLLGVQYPANSALCTGFGPEIELDGTEKFVPVLLTMEMYYVGDDVGKHPHQYTALETSPNGWADVTVSGGDTKVTLGAFVSAASPDADASTWEVLGQIPVRVDGTPAQTDPPVYVRANGKLYTPIATPLEPEYKPLATRISPSGQLQTTWKMKRIADFAKAFAK